MNFTEPRTLLNGVMAENGAEGIKHSLQNLLVHTFSLVPNTSYLNYGESLNMRFLLKMA